MYSLQIGYQCLSNVFFSQNKIFDDHTKYTNSDFCQNSRDCMLSKVFKHEFNNETPSKCESSQFKNYI